MPKPRAKIKLRGVNEVMSGPGAQAEVDRIGNKMVGVADGNYEYVPNPHRWVARGHFQTADAATAKRDAETNESLRVLGAVME